MKALLDRDAEARKTPRPNSSAQAVAVSPFIAGDPVRLGEDVDTRERLLAALGVGPPARGGVLRMAPGVALVHCLTGVSDGLEIRWAHVESPFELPEVGPVHTAVVLTAPIGRSARALSLMARLAAVLQESAVVEATRSATTREGLVRVLAAADAGAGERPIPPDALLDLLGTSEGGLTTTEAERRLTACGPNKLERVRRRRVLLKLAEQFWSFFAILLWVGGAFAFLAGMPELGWGIFGVIVVNGVFSFLQEWRAERAIEALERMLPRLITVQRDRRDIRLNADLLVPGDLVRLEAGGQVPGDGQLLSTVGLRVDESALTGESHAMFKLPATANNRARVPHLERQELVFAGTSVVSGSGLMVTVGTGMQTEIGAIAHLTQSVAEHPSPLQLELRRVTRIVTALAIGFGAAFFTIGVAGRFLSPAQAFLFALGVIVANVPEGLLPTLTLALALGVQRMARRHSLMKRLSSVETLGATTVICTDKTGTLTEGRMVARVAWTWGGAIELGTLVGPPPADLVELFTAATLGSVATTDHGDPTEKALVAGAIQLGLDPEKVRAAQELLVPYPFDSFRKRMTLIRAAPTGPIAYVKGAPQEVLALCTHISRVGGAVAFTGSMRDEVMREHDRLASEGLRMLGIAVRAMPEPLLTAGASDVERELTFLGFAGLWDPPRPEVAPALGACAGAGIRVIMITGDYGLTARAIAGRIGLPVERVVTGDEVERLAPAALRHLVAQPGVLFSRTSPAHKLAIVSALTAAGEVVAVTGDGVNDAPALKAADIGVAMGRRGSDVAKEAAVMVITDDNFASVVTAVQEGRAIYLNMGKFVTYIFASNVPELVPFLAFVLLGIPLPLTIMQILAVDLGTDLLPALALGAEPPEPGVMDRPPRMRSERLLDTHRLLHAYGFLGLAEAALSLGAFFWVYWLAGWRPGMAMASEGDLYTRATTMTLAAIVACQVGNVFACRTERASIFRVGVFRNPLVFVGIVAEVAMLLVLMLVPPLQHVFGLLPLGLDEWGVLLLLPPAMLGLEEARKCLVRRLEARGRRVHGGPS